MSQPLSPAYDGPPVCSAKGCARPAAWQLLWNNPKLHAADRRKVWLACTDHRQTLADFLAARRFLREVRTAAGESVEE